MEHASLAPRVHDKVPARPPRRAGASRARAPPPAAVAAAGLDSITVAREDDVAARVAADSAKFHRLSKATPPGSPLRTPDAVTSRPSRQREALRRVDEQVDEDDAAAEADDIEVRHRSTSA